MLSFDQLSDGLLKKIIKLFSFSVHSFEWKHSNEKLITSIPALSKLSYPENSNFLGETNNEFYKTWQGGLVLVEEDVWNWPVKRFLKNPSRAETLCFEVGKLPSIAQFGTEFRNFAKLDIWDQVFPASGTNLTLTRGPSGPSWLRDHPVPYAGTNWSGTRGPTGPCLWNRVTFLTISLWHHPWNFKHIQCLYRLR